MLVYLANIFFIIFWKYVLLNGKYSENSKKQYCTIIAFQWIVISGLRDWSVGADTFAYSNSFERVKGSSWAKLSKDLWGYIFRGVDIKDPGYGIVQKTFQIFSGNYQIFLIFIAVLFTGLMARFIYKYSTDPCLSFLLYSTLFYSFFAITGLRQTIATAIVVFVGYELIKRRKLVLFIALVLLMSLIHKSAVAILPLYWLYKLKNNSVTVWIWWIPIGLSFIFRNNLLKILQLIVGYESYEQYEGAGATTFTLLLLAVAFVCSLFYKNIPKSNTETINVSLNALYMSCFFSSLLLINQSTMRVVQYYSIFLLVLLPEIIHIFADERSKNIFRFVISSILILLLINNAPSYSFCF